MKIMAREITSTYPSSATANPTSAKSQGSIESKLFLTSPASDKVSLSLEGTHAAASSSGKIIKPTMITRNLWDAMNASKNAGEHRDVFWQISRSLSDNGEGQIAYHKFAAGLSQKDLGHFLTALEKNPQNLSNIMETASRLTEDALSPFLEAARLAQDNFDEFNQYVNHMLDQEGTSSPEFQYTYLSAAVKTGPELMKFIQATDTMAENTRNKLVDFVNTEMTSNDRANFIKFFSFANEDNLNTLIDVAVGLKGEDKSNLLQAASYAEGQTPAFMDAISKNQNLSDFLAVASHSEKRLETFLQIADTLDLKAVSLLSLVDTANFLDAAAKSTGLIDTLTRIGQGLDGEDKSYFLYAAAKNEMSPDAFLAKVEELTGVERSDFLRQTANQDEENPGPALYMKGLLSKKDYDHFQYTASGLSQDQVLNLVEMTNGFSGQIRSDFLEAGAAADQVSGEFISMFNTMSDEEQKAYLGVTTALKGGLQEKFVQASVKTDGSLTEFVQITQELLDSSTKWDGSTETLDNFLSVVQKANSNDLQGFVRLVGQLDREQRVAFLFTAEKSLLELSKLVQLGNDALSLEADKFVDIFNFSNFNSNDAKLSYGDYKNLINLAGNSNEDKWNHFLFASNHFKIPLSELVSIAENAESFGPEKFNYNVFEKIEAGFDSNQFLNVVV